MTDHKTTANMIGSYGQWAADSAAGWERSLSLLNPRWKDIEEWRTTARAKVDELLAGPPIPAEVKVRVGKRYRYEDLDIEELYWQLPYGPETEALFLKPAGSSGPLPGILGLHDHAAVKYFGKSKILEKSETVHPFIRDHRKLYYGGRPWANALARRGYGVLVHDVFPFESRRINGSELPGHVVKRMMAAPSEVQELTPEDLKKITVVADYDVGEAESLDQIEAYHAFAAMHEEVIAKSLFCAGLTWPGIFAAEDRFALDILGARPDVDSGRLGCCGLSLGGLRTNFLAGLDERIRCSVTVGFMSTWQDFILHNCYTHTWMLYIPLLSRFLDFPEILGLRAPLPAMVLATEEDPLFEPDEVKAALEILQRVYERAGKPQNFASALYPGPHQFDRAMQDRAFEWLDLHLKPKS